MIAGDNIMEAIDERVVPMTRDDLLGMPDDRPMQAVSVEAWNDRIVMMRGLTGVERDTFELTATKAAGGVRGVMALLVAMSLCDADGNRICTKADVEAINEKSAAALDVLFRHARRLSRIGEDEARVLAGN